KSPPPPEKSTAPTPYYYKSPPPPSPSPPVPYYYKSPPPPSPYPPHVPYYYNSPPPPVVYPPYTPYHHPLIVKVVGKVYCYRCYDWKYPQKSHNKKHLKGVTVEVTCEVGSKTIKAYGKTKTNGKYSIAVEGFDYVKYGATVCKAKLHAPPKGSRCNIPTKLNEGTKLKVKSKDKYEVVLKAKPFAYAPEKPYDCKKSKPEPSPTPYHKPYYYNSPPPPSPSPHPYSPYKSTTTLILL
ncbi:hypothetical protein glysoja_042282, partial [Glycine soja]